MTTKEGSCVSTPTIECCMCGDYGLISELYQCNLCSFRSQHRYCSNLYPKAQSYQLCNWCLNKDDQEQRKSDEPTHNSSSSSKQYYSNNGDNQQKYSNKNNNKIEFKNDNKSEVIKKNRVGNLKIQIKRMSNSELMVNYNNNNPMKKQRLCLDRLSSPSSVGRSLKKIKLEAESLRRTKSEEISNNNNNNTPTTPKQVVFRGKAQRYKLLEEVSSQ